MTLSSLFLRLFIFGVARVRASNGDRVLGTPTAFPFRAGLTRRSPGRICPDVANRTFNFQIACSLRCKKNIKRTECVFKSAAPRPFEPPPKDTTTLSNICHGLPSRTMTVINGFSGMFLNRTAMAQADHPRLSSPLQCRGWFAGSCHREARSACPGANHDDGGGGQDARAPGKSFSRHSHFRAFACKLPFV